ncbi:MULTISPECIES: hypothetical protein [unclassified Lysinibacillus]|uniref:hypothetical protein n=1 Tax=unclassified Lysinibacillus TaxID=2636778 RepID=UPI0037F19FAB
MGSNINVKSLVINLFSFKKPTIWVILITIITVITSIAVLARIDVSNAEPLTKNSSVADNPGYNKEINFDYIDDTYVMNNEIIKNTALTSSSNNQTPITNDGYMTFAKDIVEKYYKNKDLGENNDFSKEVSNDTLKLLNAKIELGQMQNKTLGYTYRDYQISVTPSLTEKWVESETEILMYLRVERSWFYDNELYVEQNTNKTTTSEVLKITISKAAGSDLKMIECYDLYENITLGPIDELYQKAQASNLDTDTLIDDYKKDFQERLTRIRNQMDMDMYKR